jgi:hypothetical protein
MPSPLLPDELKALIPRRADPLCGKLTTGITNWMQAVTDHFKWMYKANGEFSAAFISELCALDCMCSGTVIDPGGTPCPQISLTGTVTPDDGKLNVSFNGPGMIAGYNYNLFRRTSDIDPWVSITTGVSTGSIINYQDTGLTNGTTYYYKMEVQKAGCSIYIGLAQGSPNGCVDIIPMVEGGGSPDSPLSINVTLYELNNKFLPLETIVTMYVSTDSNSIGSPIQPTGILNSFGTGCNVGSIVKRCIGFSDFNGQALNPLVTYYCTFVIQYKAGCPEKTVKVGLRPYPLPIPPPGVRFIMTGGRPALLVDIYPSLGSNIIQYRLYRQPVGNLIPVGQEGGWYPFATINQQSTTPVSIPLVLSQWPATDRVYGTGGGGLFASYNIYGIALGPTGQTSENGSPIYVRFPTI